MPDNAVSSPSAAASTPVGAGDGKTDAEILGGGTPTVPTEVPAAPETPAAPAPSPAAPGEPTAPTTPATPADKPIAPGEAMPEALRRASAADPAVRAEVNRMWQEVQRYVSLGPAAELKALRDKFPGGIAEADKIINDAMGIQAVDAQFYEGGPEQRAELIKSLYADDPAAVIGTTEVSLQFLQQTAPQEYVRLSDGIIANGLAKGELGAHIQQLDDLAVAELKAHPDSPLAQAIRDVAEWAREKAGFRKPPTDPRQAELDRRKAELDTRDKNFNQQQFQSYQSNLNNTVVSTIGTEITSMLDTLTKDVPIADGAKELIADQILDAVEAKLRGDATLQYQLGQLLSLKRYDDNTRSQHAKLLVDRAKMLLPDVARDIFGKWTTNILAVNKATIDKKTAAASRTDVVGGGAGDNRRPATPKPGEVDYTKTSDEDILAGNIKTRTR
jgi:hypothetical protein